MEIIHIDVGYRQTKVGSEVAGGQLVTEFSVPARTLTDLSMKFGKPEVLARIDAVEIALISSHNVT